MGKQAGHSALGVPFARSRQSGSILVLTALMMVVMIGFVGLAIDVGHQMDVRRQTQNAADGAALAAAYSLYTQYSGTLPTSVPAEATKAAQLVVQQHGFSASALQSLAIVVCPTPDAFSACIQAVVGSSLPNFFLPVLGLNRSSVGTKAVAKFSTTGPCQLCVLNHSAKNAFNVSGGGSISLTNIGVVDNSVNSCGFDVTNNTMITLSISTTIGLVANPTDSSCMNGLSSTTVLPVPDPLAWVPVPTGVPVGSCASSGNACSNATPPTVAPNGNHNTVTLNPGVYGKVTLNGSDSLTLKPGIYVFTDTFSDSSSGALSVETGGSSYPAGSGVMLYFTCPSATAPYYAPCPAADATQNNTSGIGKLSLTGQGLVTLNAPIAAQNSLATTNAAYVPTAYNGILFFQDRNDGNVVDLTGQSSASTGDSYSGTIYAKSAQLSLAGGSSVSTGLDSYVVVDQLNITGNAGGLNMKATPGFNAKEATLSGLVT